MKFLVFSPSYPPRIGGLETHASEFNSYLSQLSTIHSITVFTPQLPVGAPEREIVSPKITVLRFPAFELIPNFPFPRFWTAQFRSQWRELQTVEHDILLSRTRFFITAQMAWAYRLGKRVRWVHIEHGADFSKLNSPITSLLARVYDHTLGRLVFMTSDLNIAISRAVQSFVARFDTRQAPVIYRGVEIGKIQAAPPNKALANQYKGKLKVVFVGRLIDGKGVLDLIEAISLIELKNFICFIVGDGPQEQVLRQRVAEKNLTKQIIFLGRLNFEQAMGIVKIADIFVNPSYTEGLPTAVLEACICQTAVIATDVGGTSEIFTHNRGGMLIPPRSVAALRETLLELLTNKGKRLALQSAAYEEMKEKFIWENNIKQYESIFLDLVA